MSLLLRIEMYFFLLGFGLVSGLFISQNPYLEVCRLHQILGTLTSLGEILLCLPNDRLLDLEFQQSHVAF